MCFDVTLDGKTNGIKYAVNEEGVFEVFHTHEKKANVTIIFTARAMGSRVTTAMYLSHSFLQKQILFLQKKNPYLNTTESRRTLHVALETIDEWNKEERPALTPVNFSTNVQTFLEAKPKKGIQDH